ncbi:MAG TPA: glycosyltransferase family 2 protein [bacterium]|nr:glycosyltransferase family 2 protein [bacterium]
MLALDPKGDACRLSLLVAMRNESGTIKACLKSLVVQDSAKSEFEVLVFDGESTDDSWCIAEGVLAGHGNCRVLRNPERTQSAAWNRGIRESHGEMIGIISGHTTLAHDYVRRVVETFERTGADMVGGPAIASASGLAAESIAAAMTSRFGVGDATFRYATKEQYVDTVFQGVCRRKVFERIGGFDEELVRDQDDEFSYRLLEHGGKILCNPEIRCTYFSRSSLGGLWKQYNQYGFYKVRVLQKHPKQMRPRQFVPPLFVLSLITVLGLWFLVSWGWAAFALVSGSYVLANLVASVLTASKKGWKHLPLLPVVYAILHLSYGLGFLLGLYRFWNRWGDKVGKVPSFAKRHLDNSEVRNQRSECRDFDGRRPETRNL